MAENFFILNVLVGHIEIEGRMLGFIRKLGLKVLLLLLSKMWKFVVL